MLERGIPVSQFIIILGRSFSAMGNYRLTAPSSGKNVLHFRNKRVTCLLHMEVMGMNGILV